MVSRNTFLVLAACLIMMIFYPIVGCANNVEEIDQSDLQADPPLQPEKISLGSESVVFVRDMGAQQVPPDSLYIIDSLRESPKLVLKNRLIIDVIKSPNGDRIAFKEKGGITIYSINSGEEKRIDYWGSYSWAPGGKSIYVMGRESSEIEEQPIQVELVRYDLENESAKLLTINAEEGGKRVGTEIGVSPSGTRMIFCDSNLSYFHCGDIYERSIRNMREITPEKGATYTTGPVWLNDEEVVYVERFGSDSGLDGWSTRLVKVNVDSSEKTTILDSNWSNNFVLGYWIPSFYPLTCSPDGKRIIVPVLDDPEGSQEAELALASLYVINADGSGLARLTNPKGDSAEFGDYWVSWAAR